MATVAQTQALFDTLEKEEKRPTSYPARWDAYEAALDTLQDSTKTKAAVQATSATLKAKRKRPTQYGSDWSTQRSDIGDLADA